MAHFTCEVNKLSDEKPVVLDLVPLGTAQLERAAVNNEKFSGGIKEGGSYLPTLSLKGRQFHIKAGKEKPVSLEDRTLEVIMVTARADLSKSYYAGEYDPSKDVKGPDCKSSDGKVPDADVASPISPACATCRMNAWGSKINKLTGKEGKACADFKVLILAPPTLDADKPLQLQLPAASLQNLGQYVKLLNHNGLAANEVVTKLRFTDGDSFPKLEFKYVRNLTTDEVAKTKTIEARDDVIATVKVAERVEQKSASEQPPVVPNVPPAPPVIDPPPAETKDDKPTDEVANILNRWKAK